MIAGMNEAPFLRLPTAKPGALASLKLIHAKGVMDSGFCNACLDEIKGKFFRCKVCYDFDFCAACHSKGAASIAKLKANEKHDLSHEMGESEVGAAVDPHIFETVAMQTGMEVVANVPFEGGHAMPSEGDKVWDLIARFHAGKL